LPNLRCNDGDEDDEEENDDDDDDLDDNGWYSCEGTARIMLGNIFS
jgi:hypothetical protein